MVEKMLAEGAEQGEIVRAVEDAEMKLRRRQSGSERGNRLPSDWTASQNCIDYALSHGMVSSQIQLEVEKFKNYWIARTGAGAIKRDWEATWRNWILKAMEMHHDGAGKRRSPAAASIAGRPATGANAVLAGMGRLADRLAHDRNATRSIDGQVASGSDAPLQIDPKPR
jgi:hypothetical protein